MVTRRPKRRVRLQLQSGVRLERGGPVELPGVTIEGILAGTRRGHYVVWNPEVLGEDEQKVAVNGHVEVPRDRVLFYQVIS